MNNENVRNQARFFSETLRSGATRPIVTVFRLGAERTDRRLFRFALTISLVLSLAATSVAGESAARLERFDTLVESLNAPSERRAATLELIYNELRGPDSREMHYVLRESLSRSNTLILQGAIEALAMHGDSQDVSDLDAFLATSHLLEVKSLTIRMLPAFCLSGSERSRFNYIRYAAGYERVADPAVLAPLRRPPLTRRGRLDTAQERVQVRVVRALAGQFDPVAAALRYVDDRLYGRAARATVVHYTGNALGRDPGMWASLWNAPGGGAEFREPEEVEELRMAALQSLSDMGAEGLPELIDALRPLLSSREIVLRQAVFDALADMCQSAFKGYSALAEMRLGVEDSVEAEGWRRRRLDSAVNLAAFAADGAGEALIAMDADGVFEPAAACLGAALSYPDDFPDSGGVLAGAKAQGLDLLERLLFMPGIGVPQRAAAASALGVVGAARSVRALDGIINSPYCMPENGPDGLRMAEAAVDALRAVATGEHGGRAEARAVLLRLLRDTRLFPVSRPNAPPVGLAHLVLWRLQRLARSNDVALEPEIWRMRLGW